MYDIDVRQRPAAKKVTIHVAPDRGRSRGAGPSRGWCGGVSTDITRDGEVMEFNKLRGRSQAARALDWVLGAGRVLRVGSLDVNKAVIRQRKAYLLRFPLLVMCLYGTIVCHMWISFIMLSLGVLWNADRDAIIFAFVCGYVVDVIRYRTAPDLKYRIHNTYCIVERVCRNNNVVNANRKYVRLMMYLMSFIATMYFTGFIVSFMMFPDYIMSLYVVPLSSASEAMINFIRIYRDHISDLRWHGYEDRALIVGHIYAAETIIMILLCTIYSVRCGMSHIISEYGCDMHIVVNGTCSEKIKAICIKRLGVHFYSFGFSCFILFVWSYTLKIDWDGTARISYNIHESLLPIAYTLLVNYICFVVLWASYTHLAIFRVRFIEWIRSIEGTRPVAAIRKE